MSVSGLKATIVPMIKSLMQWLIAALDDSAPEVRDAAAKCIGALAGIEKKKKKEGSR